MHHSTTVNEGPNFLEIELSLEHYEEAVVQFLDASCLALPVRFQECATPRLEGQKPRKDDERVLEYHRHTLAATHLVIIFLENFKVSRKDSLLATLFLFLSSNVSSVLRYGKVVRIANCTFDRHFLQFDKIKRKSGVAFLAEISFCFIFNENSFRFDTLKTIVALSECHWTRKIYFGLLSNDYGSHHLIVSR